MFAAIVNMPKGIRNLPIYYFRAYFCEAFYFIKRAKRDDTNKFTPRARKGRLIGYIDLYGKIF
jgi:hypothetical protein